MARPRKQLPVDFEPITSSYKKLKSGQIFNTYGELCAFLRQPSIGGNSKRSQLENFELYFEYEKEGNKFIITNVYDMPLVNYSSGAYRSLVQQLLLYRLSHSDSGWFVATTTNILIDFQMINENYKKGKDDKDELVKILDVPYSYVKDFYMRSSSKFNGILNGALNGLKSQGFLRYSTPYYVKLKNSSPAREANEVESRVLMNLENEYCATFGYKNKGHVNLADEMKHMGEWVTKMANKKLKAKDNYEHECDIDYYYEVYKIMVADKVWQNPIDNIKEIKIALNAIIVENHSKSYRSRHEKAFDNMLDECMTKSDFYAYGTKYLEDGIKLINHTIKTSE